MSNTLKAMLAMAVILACIAAPAQTANPAPTSTSANTSNNIPGPTHEVNPAAAQANEDRITREVRHELLMLPYYSVFDDLEYSVQGNTVYLKGLVVNPETKSDAEGAVKHIEGVSKVVNDIQIAPPFPADDQIRMREYRAIYGSDGLYRYGMAAVPAIHIIVDRGHVTLKGVVDNQMDKQLVDTRANSVPGVFSVKDDLVVANNQKNSTSAKK
ncbi:MAG TPA: BON domain-containing protein [Terriglobales bacterium]|nr:BON domain-containing protein [Terriglobales bacterium]